MCKQTFSNSNQSYLVDSNAQYVDAMNDGIYCLNGESENNGKSENIESKVANKSLTAWQFNLSKHYRFTKSSSTQLQVSPGKKQFEYICKLLRANTCEVIYFDERFTKEQTQTIRTLQKNSNTQLHNAKLAYLFEDTLDLVS